MDDDDHTESTTTTTTAEPDTDSQSHSHSTPHSPPTSPTKVDEAVQTDPRRPPTQPPVPDNDNRDSSISRYFRTENADQAGTPVKKKRSRKGKGPKGGGEYVGVGNDEPEEFARGGGQGRGGQPYVLQRPQLQPQTQGRGRGMMPPPVPGPGPYFNAPPPQAPAFVPPPYGRGQPQAYVPPAAPSFPHLADPGPIIPQRRPLPPFAPSGLGRLAFEQAWNSSSERAAFHERERSAREAAREAERERVAREGWAEVDRVEGERRRGREGVGEGRAELGVERVREVGAETRGEVERRNREEDALVEGFRSLSLDPEAEDASAYPYAKRPNWGTRGRPVLLHTNSFPLSLSPHPPPNLHEYSLTITPPASSLLTRHTIFSRVAQQIKLKCVAHTFAERLVAFEELDVDWHGKWEGTVAVCEELEPSERRMSEGLSLEEAILTHPVKAPRVTVYKAVIRHVRNLDMGYLGKYLAGDPEFADYDPAPLLTALQTVLSHHAAHNAGLPRGADPSRFFFPDPNLLFPTPSSSQPIFFPRRGFHLSLQPTLHRLLLTVLPLAAPFHRASSLADAMLAYSRGGGHDWHALVTGLSVQVEHGGWKKRRVVKRLGEGDALGMTVLARGFQERATVQSYFAIKYGIQLKYPYLPLVDVGTLKKPVWLPPEVCQVLPDQRLRVPVPPSSAKAMSQQTILPPRFVANAIRTDGFQRLGLHADKWLGNFGLSVSDELAVVPGRILPSPNVLYLGFKGPKATWEKAAMNADRADWHMAPTAQFVQAGGFQHWGLLLINDAGGGSELRIGDPALDRGIKRFVQMCRDCGMQMTWTAAVSKAVTLPDAGKDEASRTAALIALRDALAALCEKKPGGLVVVLPSNDKRTYAAVKYLCDTRLDVHSVCLVSSALRDPKTRDAYFANTAGKLNLKMGGTNHMLDPKECGLLTKEYTMLVGADVRRPEPGAHKGSMAVAAVVGSVDYCFSQYPASLRLQPAGLEPIIHLTDMLRERLLAFRVRTGFLPVRIIYFRTGVSESQMDAVVREEVRQMRLAFEGIDVDQGEYAPKVTFVCVGRDHRTRFFPADREGADRGGNVKPGTVVDRGVTAIYRHDFYLKPQGTPAGTAKGSKFHVLFDDNNFSADDIQQITHMTCYLFGRATKAISMPQPAYYADLAAKRGRMYVFDVQDRFEREARQGVVKPVEEIAAHSMSTWRGGVGPKLSKTMFYI